VVPQKFRHPQQMRYIRSLGRANFGSDDEFASGY
jgi:hypothetical protein